MSNDALKYYRDQLCIDKNILDDEFENHPVIYEQIGDQLAEAVSAKDAAKDNIAKVQSEVADLMRQDASDGEYKLTETQIVSDLANDTHVKRAQKRHNELKLSCDQWYALRDAWDQRGKALRELAHLYVAGYWQRQPVKDGKRTLDSEEAGKIKDELAQKRKERQQVSSSEEKETKTEDTPSRSRRSRRSSSSAAEEDEKKKDTAETETGSVEEAEASPEPEQSEPPKRRRSRKTKEVEEEVPVKEEIEEEVPEKKEVESDSNDEKEETTSPPVRGRRARRAASEKEPEKETTTKDEGDAKEETKTGRVRRRSRR